jgi:hypothetical protein
MASVVVSCSQSLKLATELLIFERMALLLDTWYAKPCIFTITDIYIRNALLLGILYLMFQAFPIIFEKGHHFNVQTTGVTFLGIGLGMGIGLSTQSFWNRSVDNSDPNCVL